MPAAPRGNSEHFAFKDGSKILLRPGHDEPLSSRKSKKNVIEVLLFRTLKQNYEGDKAVDKSWLRLSGNMAPTAPPEQKPPEQGIIHHIDSMISDSG